MIKLKKTIDIPKKWDIVYALCFERDIDLWDVLWAKDIKIVPCTIDVVSADWVVLMSTNKKIDWRQLDLWYGLSEYQYRYFKLWWVAKIVRNMIIHSWSHMKDQIDIPSVIHRKSQS